jgi:hypothetical protein
VSKRPCPVCHKILEETYRHYGVHEKVSPPSSHREICACYFPPGLPIEVMRRVLAHFKSLLKGELEKIHEDKGVRRQGSHQSDTAGRLTSDTERRLMEGMHEDALSDSDSDDD